MKGNEKKLKERIRNKRKGRKGKEDKGKEDCEGYTYKK